VRLTKTLLILAVILGAALSGCSRDGENIVQEGGPEALYDRGVDSMASGNFPTAIAYFQALEARYPFSNVTRQAQLDMVYAYYRNRQPESAIDAAEEFERENPTHPRVDYCLYMKGLAYFDEAPNFIEKWFRVDMTERPPRDTMQAFSVFQELLRRFPSSHYAPDTRERMIFLRNRLAAYENHVATYYIERGAFVAAINRAKYTLEHYPGAPAIRDSLELMITAYEELGMRDLAEDTRRVLQESYGEIAAAN
jgi:outer membrane protein assembly factor BamD